MSNYVSELIAEDINNINVARKLSDVSNNYNLEILALIGDESSVKLPDFDAAAFMAHCDSLRSTLTTSSILPLADSVEYSYSAFMLTSLELQNVLLSDFIDTRSWYFDRLQPRFVRLHSDLDKLSFAIHKDLLNNSERFERGFYRSIIPGVVAVGVGLLLVIMLLFYLLAYYVNPLYKMLEGVNGYRSLNKRYNLKFEGDDQLAELNKGISEVISENQDLRRRLKNLRNQ